MSSAFSPAEYIQVLFKLDFIMETNSINPDQTDPRSVHYDRMNVCLNNHISLSFLRVNMQTMETHPDQTPQNVASDQGLHFLLTEWSTNIKKHTQTNCQRP